MTVQVDAAPVLTTSAGTAAFTEHGGPVTVDGGLTVTDADNSTLASATVTISNIQDTGAEILSADTAGTALTRELHGADPDADRDGLDRQLPAGAAERHLQQHLDGPQHHHPHNPVRGQRRHAQQRGSHEERDSHGGSTRARAGPRCGRREQRPDGHDSPGSVFTPGTNGTANPCAPGGGPNYIPLASVQGGGGTLSLRPVYCVVAATGNYQAAGVGDRFDDWSVVVATYRG